VSIQAVNKGLYRGLVNMSDVGGRLARFPSRNDGMGVDEAEGIDYDLSLNGLYGVDNNGD
jgi:hypothetical protein